MPNRLTQGEAQAGSFRTIGGDAIDKMIIGTASVDPASINAATKGSIAVTVTGAKVGDIVIANPPSALEAGLLFIGAYVSNANEVTILLYNPTGGAVNGAALTWNIMIISEVGN